MNYNPIKECINNIHTNVLEIMSAGYSVDRIESDLNSNTVHIYFRPKISSIVVDFTIYPN